MNKQFQITLSVTYFEGEMSVRTSTSPEGVPASEVEQAIKMLSSQLKNCGGYRALMENCK